MTHDELVRHAAGWLRNKYAVVVTEIASTGEEPDAIGYDSCGNTCLIECKVSRADFKRDAKKYYRRLPSAGLGALRYYCAPDGLIQLHELPENWGLLEAVEGGRGVWLRQSRVSRPQERNMRNEIILLTSVCRRLGIKSDATTSIKVYKYETKNRATLELAIDD